MRPFWRSCENTLSSRDGPWSFPPRRLFGLGWLFVYVTSLNEAEIREMLESGEGGGRIQWLRSLGVAEQPRVGDDHDGVLEPSVHLVVDLDVGDRAGLGRRSRRGRARDDGLDPVAPDRALGLSVLGRLHRVGWSGRARRVPDGRSLDRGALQRPAGSAQPVDIVATGGQPGRARPADLRLYAPGVSGRPRALACHLDRICPDAGRLHRLRDLVDPRARTR